MNSRKELCLHNVQSISFKSFSELAQLSYIDVLIFLQVQNREADWKSLYRGYNTVKKSSLKVGKKYNM